MKNQLLLLEDVDNVGKKGQLVSVRPGFARNFLLPQKKAIVADKNIVRLQTRLQQERQQQAKVFKEESETIAKELATTKLTLTVKVDPEGHLYGSVTALDIAKLLHSEKGLEINKRDVLLDSSIKKLGTYTVDLKLKEDVMASFSLHVLPEDETVLVKPETVSEIKEEVEETSETSESSEG